MRPQSEITILEAGSPAALLASLLWLGSCPARRSFLPPLAPIATLYHALCGAVPALAILGNSFPRSPLALLLLVVGVVMIVGSVTGSGS